METRSNITSALGKRRSLGSLRSAMQEAIRSSASSRSSTVKSREKPSTPACWRSSTCAAWWKVPPNIFRTSAKDPASSSTRRVISRAALLVKVSSSTPSGGTPRSSIRATRNVSVRVLPEPAPAMTSTGPSPASTARSCSSLSSRS
jgi:hypothetical protein